MAKSATNPKVDWYFIKNTQWQEEIVHMRDIALGSGLTEELKWGCPCYTLEGSNVVLIHVFKDYCAYLFFKGALLKDPKKILVQQTANVQAARQVRFTGVKEIIKLKSVLKTYIKNAIELEKSGAKIEFKQTSEFSMPEEFKARLDKDTSLKKAFYTLTPGRQRGYLLFFSSAKQAVTRESRIKKCIPQIMNGKGLND
jgi:uncharacterized protein YdeI (YjbR/CyaY-like superfamily)